MVFSASESFAAFAKETNWATLVGIPTGGAGISITPVFFTLPNSKLVIRMPVALGLNPDGSVNKEKKTTPHLFIEEDPYDYIKLYKNMDGFQVYPEEDRVLRMTMELIRKDKLVPRKPEMQGVLQSFFEGYDGVYGYEVTTEFSKYEGRRIEKIGVYGAYKTDEQLLVSLTGLSEGQAFSTRRLELIEKIKIL